MRVALQAVVAAIDGAEGNAELEIRSADGLLLVTMTVSRPSFTTADGTLMLNGVPLSGPAVASGTAALACIATSTTVPVQLSVTAMDGGGDVQLSSTEITTGQNVVIGFGRIRPPA